MDTRTLGRTGLTVSVLGFGCGAVGGLMVGGAPADQERALADALTRGVTYLDTAPQYGDGLSEENLGRLLAKLKPVAAIGTKLRLKAAEKSDIAGAVAAGIEASLRRLGRDHVDIFHLHNAITAAGGGADLTPAMVLEEVLPAFAAVRDAGKTRFIGLTAVGDTASLLQVIDSGAFDTAQVAYNLLNPTAGTTALPGYRGQDFAGLLTRMRQQGMGAIGIRVLAGGALSGSPDRHPLASPPPAPIGSGNSYATDLAWAEIFKPLVTEGHAGSLIEAAIRYAIGNALLPTTLIGIATPKQFALAADAADKGPLSPAALARVADLQRGLGA